MRPKYSGNGNNPILRARILTMLRLVGWWGKLDDFFRSKVGIPLIRHGKRQRIETLVNEEALLLAKYLRDEKT